VAPGVFVPRRRSELLVREAAALAPPRPVVVDLCCGSGAVAAALTAVLGEPEVHASDVDPAAVACARRNLPAGTVHAGDLFAALPDGLRGRVDVLVANVPYVPSDAVALMPPEARDHEPRTALDGGRDGLDVARRVVAGAPGWLAPGGSLLFEVGEAQVPAATAVVAEGGLVARVATDDEIGATVVVGTLPGG
jgi:release factor glutamine methyltransferase